MQGLGPVRDSGSMMMVSGHVPRHDERRHQAPIKPGYDLELDVASRTKVASPEVDLRPPHPALEIFRHTQILELRQFYEKEICGSLGLEAAPRESFNRWLFCMMASDKPDNPDYEPLLLDPETAHVRPVLRREVLECTPMRVKFNLSPEKLKQQLDTYQQSVENFIRRVGGEVHSLSEEAQEEFQSLSEDFKAISFAIMNYGATRYEEEKESEQVSVVRDNLKEYTQDVKRLVFRAAELYFDHKWDEVMPRLVQKSQEVSDAIVAFGEEYPNQFASLFEARLEGDGSIDEDLPDGVSKVWYYPAERRHSSVLMYSGNRVVVLDPHLEKLRALYNATVNRRRAALDLAPLEINRDALDFKVVVFTLLMRYETLFGTSEAEQYSGGGFHAALPERVFARLKEAPLEISQEIFASPLNCYFQQFCSGFPDIDAWFGSRGSAFWFQPVSGSYEVGPPYTEEVMLKAAHKCDEWLAASDEPLSFLVFVPEWNDPPSPVLQAFGTSEFLEWDFIATGQDHKYISGHQHTPKGFGRRRYYVVPHGTHVYLLQNKAGKARYPADDEYMMEIEELMCPSMSNPIQAQYHQG